MNHGEHGGHGEKSEEARVFFASYASPGLFLLLAVAAVPAVVKRF